MSSEILRTGLDVAPIAGVVVGAGVGAFVEGYLQKKYKQEQHSVNEIMGVVNEEAAAPPSRLERSGLVYFASALAITSAAAGGINAYAFLPQAKEEDKTSVQVVVDRSGATQYGSDADKPAQQIDSVIDAFNKNGKLELTAHVAQSGEVSLKRAEEVAAVQPFGDAPMRQAFKSANDTITLKRTNNQVTEDDKTATVIITNGNTIGKARNIAKQTAANKNSVYVVNVNDDTKSSNARSLKSVTEKTGGQYWGNSAGTPLNAGQIADAVAKNVSPKSDEKNNDSKNMLKLLGVITLLGAAAVGLQRRKLAKTLNGTTIK